MINIATGHSYKTPDIAASKLRAALHQMGLYQCRYCIAINDEGRFVPMVHLTTAQQVYAIGLANLKITVVS